MMSTRVRPVRTLVCRQKTQVAEASVLLSLFPARTHRLSAWFVLFTRQLDRAVASIRKRQREKKETKQHRQEQEIEREREWGSI